MYMDSKRSLSPNNTQTSQTTINTNVTMNYYNKINKNIPSTMTIDNHNFDKIKSHIPHNGQQNINQVDRFKNKVMKSERYTPYSQNEVFKDNYQVLLEIY